MNGQKNGSDSGPRNSPAPEADACRALVCAGKRRFRGNAQNLVILQIPRILQVKALPFSNEIVYLLA
jgi:hypothetical protein